MSEVSALKECVGDERGSGEAQSWGRGMAMEEASFELVLNDGPDLWWLRQGRREEGRGGSVPSRVEVLGSGVGGWLQA